MRNRALHDALRAFALESARLLRDDQSAGAELEFDLEEGSRRSGPALYHYRPLTQKFIAERWLRLSMLESCLPAAHALGSGASAYLRVNGLGGAEAEPALQAMLERLYEDATDFTFPEERFERVYAEVERTLFENSRQATVLVPIYGLELEAERVDLGEEMSIVRGDHTEAPDEAVWGDPADPASGLERSRPNALLMLSTEVSPDDPVPAAEAPSRFRRLLTGLRLWKPGGVALAALAWRRTGDGRWQPFEIEATGAARGEPWILVEGEDPDLRQFLAVIGKATHGGAVAWALSRFEMGCGRRFEAEALSDYLLGLRALLESGAETGRSSLALSVAVLCGEEDERRRVQRRVELAQALERFVMGDGPDDDYVDAVGPDSPRTLVDETERHLRALLRDVLCGYLDADLRAVAEELLLEQPERFEIRARALGREATEPEPQRHESSAVAAEAHESVTSELEALEEAGELGAGVIEAEVPQPDDDPASYSAPV